MMVLKAQFRYSLDVKCPKCKDDIDLLDQDEDGCFTTPIFTNQWDELEGEMVICPICDHEFTIDGVDY